MGVAVGQQIDPLREDNDPLRGAKVFETYAGRFLQGHQVDVEIVRRRFDVLERRRCDCFLEEKVIGTYSTGGGT
jgi:hypothetical protein